MLSQMRRRLFFTLWIPGMVGVLSLLLIDLAPLIAALPLSETQTRELPPPMLLKLLSIVQPTILMTLAVFVGMWLAPRIGLSAPAAEAFAAGEPWLPRLRRQLASGVTFGLVGGVLIVLSWVLMRPFLSGEFAAKAEAFNQSVPHAVRFLYGGFTEEILLRWGFMTLLVWILCRLMDNGHARPSSTSVVSAIFVSSLLFGLGHLPVASMLNGGLDAPIVVYVTLANSLFGIIAGLLYWKRGLESAMIAHMMAHLVMIVAITFAL
jgi:hypothetical protein